MTEKILHFVWQNKILPGTLLTIDNKRVEVLHPGYPSVDSGPDFTQARIKIGNKIWVGSVEIHNKSSDWFRHKHNAGKSYDTVILHVVGKYDKPVYRSNGEVIPTLELPVPENISQNFKRLYKNTNPVKCQSTARHVPSVLKENWLSNLLIERLESRREEISELLHSTKNDWEQVFYLKLARAFGQKVNSDAFELLAKSLDLNIIRRNSNNKTIVEALLVGQAGLLSRDIDDEYYRLLQEEYAYLRTKYNLQPLNPDIWRFMRIRPHNFPTIKFSLLADLLTKKYQLFSYVREIEQMEGLINFFKAKAGPYWDNHYNFGKLSSRTYTKILGKKSLDNIIINAVVPVLYAYGRFMGDQVYVDRALSFLEQLDFEQNYITKYFSQAEFPSENASHSQAQLHLYKNYCLNGGCFRCRVGSAILIDKYA